MEIGNLPEKVFKVMTVKMIKELKRRIRDPPPTVVQSLRPCAPHAGAQV